jgi:hypothetical protein
MRTFIGTVKTFNGRYWKSHDVRVKASSLEVAIGKACRGRGIRGPRERIEAMTVNLTAVKEVKVRIVEEELQEDRRNCSPSTPCNSVHCEHC